MALHPTTIDEIDLWDLDMFTSGDPHDAWRILRREAPVWWHDRPGGEASWAVTRYDDARTVQVCVDDDGPGIPDDELDLVFTKFYRRAVAQPSGTGLGLWISRALADAHGGSLTATANARGGTTFCLTLPTDRNWPELDALGLG